MGEFKVQSLKFKVVIFLIFEFLILNFALSRSSAELTIKANHDHIKVNFFYHGDEVTVSGTSDPGMDILVKITSPEGHQVFKKKGKVAGILWMNVGTLQFNKVPDIYFLHSTKRMEDVLTPQEMDRYIIGYPYLMKYVEIEPVSDETDKERWFKEFVKFKESSRLYNLSYGDVFLTEKGDTQDYYVKIPWPYQASPGMYTVTVYSIKDRKVVETVEARVRVEQVGLFAPVQRSME